MGVGGRDRVQSLIRLQYSLSLSSDVDVGLGRSNSELLFCAPAFRMPCVILTFCGHLSLSSNLSILHSLPPLRRSPTRPSSACMSKRDRYPFTC